MKAMEEQLALGTDDSFLAAKRIYKYGGNSKSYAVLTIPSGLPGAVSETTPLSGKADSGAAVYGEAYANADAGATELKFKYDTTEIQETYMSCQVGGLTTTNLEGCKLHFVVLFFSRSAPFPSHPLQ